MEKLWYENDGQNNKYPTGVFHHLAVRWALVVYDDDDEILLPRDRMCMDQLVCMAFLYAFFNKKNEASIKQRFLKYAEQAGWFQYKTNVVHLCQQLSSSVLVFSLLVAHGLVGVSSSRDKIVYQKQAEEQHPILPHIVEDLQKEFDHYYCDRSCKQVVCLETILLICV